MTLIATCRFENKAIYIHDYRVTNASGQRDALVKWIFSNDRLGLLVAGLVEFWKDVSERLEVVKDEISIDNILDDTGPLHEVLLDAALQCPCDPQYCGALGFIIDTNHRTNRQFAIDIKTGIGARIIDLSHADVMIMGKGSSVPHIEDNIRYTFQRCRDIIGDDTDLFQIGNCVRSEVYASFSRQGTDSFQNYGVSSIMGMALLDGDSFWIPGEDAEGAIIDLKNKQYTETGYSYTNNEDNGLTITDKVGGTTVELSLVSEAPDVYNNIIIDPEHRAGS